MILIGKHTKHQSNTPDITLDDVSDNIKNLTIDLTVMSCDSKDTLIKKQNTYANNVVVYCRDTGKMYINTYGKFEELSMI